jgi:nicotinamidase-related amidase
MTHRFTKESGALLIVDVQERLVAAMPPERAKRMIERIRAAIVGAKALSMPVVVTEQYPKGLGPTVREIAELVTDFSPIEKLEFSALVRPVRERLSARPNVLVTGIETHVCVFQTVRALKDAGLSPYLAVDGVLSRSEIDCAIGLELCRRSGAEVTTVEAALFDALQRAGTPEFKAISSAVK